jgi:gamma-butyrobetaine dioxygenase
MNIEFDSSELRLFVDNEAIRLHPLWMRERSKEETAVDQRSFQRLYDPETLEDNLTFADAKQLDQDEILIKFSDQHEAKYSLKDLLLEVGRKDNLPQKILWNTENLEFKEFNFDYSLKKPRCRCWRYLSIFINMDLLLLKDYMLKKVKLLILQKE